LVIILFGQSFLFSGTTTMMAAALDGDGRDADAEEEKPRTARTLIGALQISILVGIGLGAFVFGFARQLLGLIIGGGTVDPNIVGVAEKFVQIRALGFPAAAMLGSAQTACLAQGDAKMPLLATVICALINLGLDLLFIGNSHAWLGGVAGAAVATTLSQYVAAGWVVHWLTTTKQKKRSQKEESSNTSHSTKGFLAGRMRVKDLFRKPSNDTSKGFAPFVIPVITTQLGRCSAVAAIDHVVSSSLSTASMAANQIVTSVYYGLVPVAESLSLAAQNFVPGITERDKSNPREKSYAMRSLLKSFLKAAGLCGLFLAAVIGTLPLYCGAFTSDAVVRTLVTTVVPLFFVTCLKHGIFCSSEGILLGQKDLRFLGTQYGIYTFLIPYLLLQIKKAALGGSPRVGLASVWQLFLGYDLFRTALMVGRILWLERKRANEKEVVTVQPAYLSSS
jgi:Na+-driven multidrug efflux pump